MSGGEPVDWCRLVPRLIHPTKVLIIESMLWIDRPMSASELVQILDGTVSISSLSYHIGKLVEDGVLEQVRERRIRGATERFYDFAKLDG
jgi:DNA-binding transcriptional ArsR family regulator